MLLAIVLVKPTHDPFAVTVITEAPPAAACVTPATSKVRARPGTVIAAVAVFPIASPLNVPVVECPTINELVKLVPLI